ncbi:hypothetical protein D3C80_1805550 [compost metagenome]
MTVAQGVGEGLFVDQAAAGGVDHEGTGLHGRQFTGADEVSSVFVERAVQGQCVNLRQQFFQRQTVGPGRAPRDLAE